MPWSQLASLHRVLSARGHGYGYMAAWCLAGRVWDDRLARDPWDPAAGRALRAEVLEAGFGAGPAGWAARVLQELAAEGGTGGGGAKESALRRVGRGGGLVPRVGREDVARWLLQGPCPSGEQ